MNSLPENYKELKKKALETHNRCMEAIEWGETTEARLYFAERFGVLTEVKNILEKVSYKKEIK